MNLPILSSLIIQAHGGKQPVPGSDFQGVSLCLIVLSFLKVYTALCLRLRSSLNVVVRNSMTLLSKADGFFRCISLGSCVEHSLFGLPGISTFLTQEWIAFWKLGDQDWEQSCQMLSFLPAQLDSSLFWLIARFPLHHGSNTSKVMVQFLFIVFLVSPLTGKTLVTFTELEAPPSVSSRVSYVIPVMRVMSRNSRNLRSLARLAFPTFSLSSVMTSPSSFLHNKLCWWADPSPCEICGLSAEKMSQWKQLVRTLLLLKLKNWSCWKRNLQCKNKLHEYFVQD